MFRMLAPVAVLALVATPALAHTRKAATHKVHKAPKTKTAMKSTTTETTKKTS